MSSLPGFVLPANVTATVEKWQARASAMRASLGDGAQRDWYRITNQADSDEAEVMLYDEIGGWFGSTADQFIADLRGVTAPNLRVRINSPGGSVFEGIAIANALRSHPANVTVQVDGIAASIASVIAMAGDRVEMAPNTMLMIHDASGLCMGNATDMEEMGELLDLISDNIADAYAAKAGGTREQWRARMQAETWYLPEDAVEAGLADEATKTPKTGTTPEQPDEDEPEPKMRRAFDLTAYGYHGPAPASGGIVTNTLPAGEDNPGCEVPKPGPPPAALEQPTLTIDIGSVVGEEFAEMLRESIRARNAAPDPATPTPDAAPVEPVAAAVEPEPAQPEPVPADGWTALTAHLTEPDPDPWTALTAHLIETPASSSAAMNA